MHQRTGSANLPLHGGHVPLWLSSRMAALGRVIAEAIVHEYGRDEFLRRPPTPSGFNPSAPSWAWIGIPPGSRPASSALEARFWSPIQHELGIYVCGGKGAQSRPHPR